MFINVCYSLAKLMARRDGAELTLARIKKKVSTDHHSVELTLKELGGIEKDMIRLKGLVSKHLEPDREFFEFVNENGDQLALSSLSKYLIKAFISLVPQYDLINILSRVSSDILKIKVLEIMEQ